MKKILLSTMALFLIYAKASAQDLKTEKFQQNFLALTGGPTFPIGDFSSTDVNNENAGMAKTGFTVELKYGHQFNYAFGLAVGGFYGRHSADKKFVSEAGNVSIDPWQYYGIVLGPMVTTSVSPKTSFDLSVLTGATYTTSPKVTYNSLVIMDNDWSITVPVKLAADFRIGVGNAAFLFAGANYMYMRPKFNTTTTTGNYDFHQTISTLGVNAGVGFHF